MEPKSHSYQMETPSRRYLLGSSVVKKLLGKCIEFYGKCAKTFVEYIYKCKFMKFVHLSR